MHIYVKTKQKKKIIHNRIILEVFLQKTSAFNYIISSYNVKTNFSATRLKVVYTRKPNCYYKFDFK